MVNCQLLIKVGFHVRLESQETTGCSLSELPQVKLFLNKLALADKQIVFNSNQQPQPGKKEKGDKPKTVTNLHRHVH